MLIRELFEQIKNTPGSNDKKQLLDKNMNSTIVVYETAIRLLKTLKTIKELMPNREISIVREITKMYEETIIGYPSELMNITPPRGEIVIVVAPRPEHKMSDAEISNIVNDIAATSMKSAAADLAARAGISKKEAYKRLLEKGGNDD